MAKKGHVYSFQKQLRKAELRRTHQEKEFWVLVDPFVDALLLMLGRKRDVFDIKKFAQKHPETRDDLNILRRTANVRVMPDRCPLSLAIEALGAMDEDQNEGNKEGNLVLLERKHEGNLEKRRKFSSADILEHKECVNLSYDNKQLKWLGSFDSLKKFVKFGIKLHGHWSSPGGYSKKISCSSPVISITWYPGKQNSLILHGEASVALSDALTEAARVIASQNNSPSKSNLLDVSKSSDGVSMSYCAFGNSDKSSTQRFYCDCQCSLLAADLEGIKLEIAVMQSVLMRMLVNPKATK